MTKYKLNNTVRSATEVTLTSYMAGSTDSRTRADDRVYQIQLDTNQNDNVNSESNRNLDAAKGCHVCPHSCEFLQQSGKLAASLEKPGDKFGVNELKVEGLEKSVCLCEKYNGGCKLCPRPSLAATLSLSLDGKETCLACHESSQYNRESICTHFCDKMYNSRLRYWIS